MATRDNLLEWSGSNDSYQPMTMNNKCDLGNTIYKKNLFYAFLFTLLVSIGVTMILFVAWNRAGPFAGDSTALKLKSSLGLTALYIGLAIIVTMVTLQITNRSPIFENAWSWSLMLLGIFLLGTYLIVATLAGWN